MRKHRRRWWVGGLVVVVLAGAGVATWLLLRGDQAQAVQYLTTTAQKGTIQESIEADFTLSWATDAVTLSTSQGGVITGIFLKVGQKLQTLQKLVTVSGVPVYAFVSAAPLYRDLSYGKEGSNVKVLERALKAAGYDPGTVDQTFDEDTQSALLDWQDDQNLDQTGTLATASFVWVPRGAVVESVTATKGAQAASLGTARVSSELQADAQIGQADISSLKVGQKATLTIDGHEDTALTGTIVSISREASSSGATGGTSSAAASYPVTFRLSKTPSFARPGMSGTLSIIIAQKKDVVLVPTSAVMGSGSSPFVRVMLDGKMSYRQVTTGMTTSSTTEIASGLAVGETVVTGQVTSGSSNASNSSGSSGSLLTGGAAGGPPSGGFPSGGFPSGGFPQRQNNSSSGGGQ